VSLTEVKIRELKARELTEEEIKGLVDEILQNPDRYQTEAKLILKLKTDFRRRGCGYRYLYSNDYKVLYGEVDEVVLYRSEFNCDVSEDVAIIPKTVPVVVLQRHHDDNPDTNDYATLYVFTGSEWKSMKFPIPK